jgi:hypothetical protein
VTSGSEQCGDRQTIDVKYVRVVDDHEVRLGSASYGVELLHEASLRLWWVWYWIGIGADDDLSPLSGRLRHIVELRACAEECALSNGEHAEQAEARIAAVIDWLARPAVGVATRRRGSPVRAPADAGNAL